MSRSKVIRIPKPSETDLVPPAGNTQAANESLLMNHRALGHMLMIPVGTLRRWRLTGVGPAFLKLNGLVRYRRADVMAWLETRPSRG
jgi:hypothetical protein